MTQDNLLQRRLYKGTHSLNHKAIDVKSHSAGYAVQFLDTGKVHT